MYDWGSAVAWFYYIDVLFFSFQEYTPKQLQVLVTVGVGSRLNKRSRQKLLAIIDELDKARWLLQLA